MAALKTTDVKTIKQSWHEVVSQLDREETPFLSAIGSSTSGNVIREFFSKKLNEAVENAGEEGAPAPEATNTATDRASNVMQIFRKTRSVSGTLEATDNVGVSSKFAEQLEDAGKELKRDIEKALLGPQGSVLNGTRKLAGSEAWIKSNANHGATGATLGYDAATNTVASVTDGTLRDFTEDQLNNAFQAIWEQGGRAKSIYVGGAHKRKIGTFTGGTTVNTAADKKTIINAVDYYEGAFGKYTVVASYLMRTRTVLLIDEKTWNVSYLRKIEKKNLPANGDFEAKMLVTELTLEALNERGNGKIADVK